MATNSKIQWTTATWNVARGCTKVDDDCKYCYMYRDSFNETRYQPKEVVRTKSVFNLPLRLKEPSLIFTSSLTDFFHESIDSYRWEAFDIIRRCPHHTFQILTKRPERVKEALYKARAQAAENNNTELEEWLNKWFYYSPPQNVWLGTSIGSQKSMSRLYDLIEAPAHLRFLSLEPLHSPVFLPLNEPIVSSAIKVKDLIGWVIVGGESGNENGKYRYRPCELTWIGGIVRDCKLAEVPVFVKQIGTYLAKQLKLKDRHGGNMDEWPASLQIREMPEGF